jgi:hypothetical protein
MNVEKLEHLLSTTPSRTLWTHCGCGEAFEIRSPRRDALEISTSSGKKWVKPIENAKKIG